MAVADGGRYYTPPANVVKMTGDLAFLPAWLGDEGDQVLVGTLPDDVFMETVCRPLQLKCLPVCLDTLVRYPDLKGEPWGQSPKMGHWLAEHGYGEAWKTEQKEWYSRKTARAGLSRLLEVFPDLETGILPQVCFSLAEIAEQIKGGCYLVKAPWSSSGKGQLALADQMGKKEQEWLSGMLRRQGYLMLEKRLNKVKDFAMEFYKGEKGIEFLGWSAFVTGERGEYQGNFIGAAEKTEEELQRYLPAGTLEILIREIPKMLKCILPKYFGYLGVDMMIYRKDSGEYGLQPCVEINLRYNMGIVALFFSRRYVENTTQGKFEIRYYSRAGQALEENLRLQKEHPVLYKNNRIRSGYLNLTPVTGATRFVASVRCY